MKIKLENILIIISSVFLILSPLLKPVVIMIIGGIFLVIGFVLIMFKVFKKKEK